MRRKVSKFTILAVSAVFAMALPGCAGKSSNEVQTEYIEEESSTYAQLSKNDAARFTYEDLTVDGVKMGMTQDEVRQLLGEPSDMGDGAEPRTTGKEATEIIFVYEKDEAHKTSLFFWKLDGQYKLCGVESTDESRKFARNTQVGMSREQIIDAYYRDVNCLNANVMSEDNATILGKFLYGDKTLDKLGEQQNKEGIQYGMINYNGQNSLEAGGSIVEYLYFVPPFMGENAGYNDDYAQIIYYTDGKGSVTQIGWYYYPEVTE